MIPFAKRVLKRLFNKFGYIILSDTVLSEEVPNMASPDLNQKMLDNCRMMASRELILSHLPKGGIMAEIGVASGYFTRHILDQLHPDQLYAIDLYDYHLSKNKDQSHEELFQERFNSEINQGIVHMKKGLSWEVLETFPDAYFDYIYLDADHTYESVVKDLSVIKRKIKPSGILQCNDYTTFNPIALMGFGVQRAVNEFMLAENYEMIYYSLTDRIFVMW